MDRQWLVSIGIKFILIAVLPLSILIDSEYFNYHSLLINIGGTPYFFPPDYISIDTITVIATFIVCLLPAIVFHYHQYHKPRTESVGRSFAVALLLTQQFSMYMLLWPIVLIFSPITTAYYSFMISFIIAVYVAPWTMLFFVVLPYFMRMMEPSSASYLTVSRYELRFLGPISRFTVAAILLGLSVTVFPFYLMDDPRLLLQVIGSGVELLTGVGLIEFYSYSAYTSIGFSTMSGMNSYPVIISTIAFVLYSTEVFKYLRLERSRYRTIVLGVVLTIVSAITVMVFLSYSSFRGVPIPSTLLMSLAIMYGIGPMDTNELWDGKPHQMWFESDRDADDKPSPPKVKIPLSYLIRSKLKRGTEETKEFDWQQEEDVFDNTPEN